MLKGKKILCIIPARGGSKTIKNKNLLTLGKKNLVQHVIDYAKSVPHLDKIILSSDSKKILKIGDIHKIDTIKRTKRNSKDQSLVVTAISETIDYYKKKKIFFDIVVLLEPTCPFRKKKYLLNCLKILVTKKIDSISTFSSALLNPNRGWTVNKSIPKTYFNGLVPWNRKQSFKKAYQLNGAIYAFKTKRFNVKKKSLLFGKTFAYVCDDKDILIDIDNNTDYLFAKLYYEYNKKN
jgi:CMP-N,N'-diacetyllegionaminic acid synthase